MDSRNIFNCSEPFLILMKIFGLFPLTLNKKRRFRTTAIDVFSTVCAILVFICLGTVSFMDIFSFKIGSIILEKAWSFICKLAVFLQFLTMAYQLWKCQEVATILTSLHKVDAKVFKILSKRGIHKFYFQLMKVSVTPNLRKHQTTMFAITFFVMSVSFSTTFLIPLYHFFSSYSILPIASLTFVYLFFYMEIFVLQFTFSCFLVKVRFEFLNSILRLVSNLFCWESNNNERFQKILQKLLPM